MDQHTVQRAPEIEAGAEDLDMENHQDVRGVEFGDINGLIAEHLKP
jgi:hypothetical protein